MCLQGGSTSRPTSTVASQDERRRRDIRRRAQAAEVEATAACRRAQLAEVEATAATCERIAAARRSQRVEVHGPPGVVHGRGGELGLAEAAGAAPALAGACRRA